MDDTNQVSDDYSRHYSEASFWEKITKHAKQIGATILEKALILYQVSKDKDVPTWAKAVAIVALGYLIFPLDAIPDPTPFVGYADDAGALATAVAAIAAFVTRYHREFARRKLEEWFGKDLGGDAETY